MYAPAKQLGMGRQYGSRIDTNGKTIRGKELKELEVTVRRR